MAHHFVNNENISKDSLKYIISEKKLPKIWENNPPKLTYDLLQTLFSVIDESSFWTSSDIVSPITIISGLTEERVRSILQQPNNIKKKVNNALKKKPDLTETYPVFILSDKRKVESKLKSCSKLGITLDTINNYQLMFFFL